MQITTIFRRHVGAPLLGVVNFSGKQECKKARKNVPFLRY